MKMIIGAVIVGFAVNCFCAVEGPFSIRGTLKSFDQQFVVIESADIEYSVPRALVGLKHLKPSQRIHLLLSPSEAKTVKAKRR